VPDSPSSSTLASKQVACPYPGCLRNFKKRGLTHHIQAAHAAPATQLLRKGKEKADAPHGTEGFDSSGALEVNEDMEPEFYTDVQAEENLYEASGDEDEWADANEENEEEDLYEDSSDNSDEFDEDFGEDDEDDDDDLWSAWW